MSTEITRSAPTALTIREDQTRFTPEQEQALLNHAGVSRNASDADVEVFFHQVKRTGLDPFAKQIHMIERQGKQTIQVGIDGFRLIARRAVDKTGEALGYEDNLWCDQNGNWRDVPVPGQVPVAAKVTVLRNGQRYPAVALYEEYVARKKNGDVNAMWSQRPAGQLAKCAEALALRKAFPQDLAGLYTSEEMQQADNPDRARPAPAQSQQAQSAPSPDQAQQKPVKGPDDRAREVLQSTDPAEVQSFGKLLRRQHPEHPAIPHLIERYNALTQDPGPQPKEAALPAEEPAPPGRHEEVVDAEIVPEHEAAQQSEPLFEETTS